MNDRSAAPLAPRRTAVVAIGLGTALAAAAVLAALACTLGAGAVPAAWDERAVDALQRGLAPAWTTWLAAVSALHAPRVVLAMTTAFTLAITWCGDRAAAAMLAAAVFGGSALNHLLKHALERARPHADAALAAATDHSFPSGHVASATLLWGALALLLALEGRRRRRMAGVAATGATILVATVALSRVALGRHYPSDALAGVALGVGWLALCGTALLLHRSRAAHRMLTA